MLGKKILCDKGTKQGLLISFVKLREVPFNLGLSNKVALTQGDRKRIPDTYQIPKMRKATSDSSEDILEDTKKDDFSTNPKPKSVCCRNLRWDSHNRRPVSLGLKYQCIPIYSQVGLALHPFIYFPPYNKKLTTSINQKNRQSSAWELLTKQLKMVSSLT